MSSRCDQGAVCPYGTQDRGGQSMDVMMRGFCCRPSLNLSSVAWKLGDWCIKGMWEICSLGIV